MTIPNLYTLYQSTNPKKKFDIYVINPNTNRIKKVSFGSSAHSDYTIHKDIERKKRYLLRHKNDSKNDITKPGFWAKHILWNQPISPQDNLKLILQ